MPLSLVLMNCMASEANDARVAGQSLIDVEVAYARPDVQLLVPCQVPPQTTVREVLTLSGLAEAFPEIDVATCPLGIFGKSVEDGHVVESGDRVEVYRPLRVNPREARRERRARQRRALQD
jgi:putative ubiquitin-RnfH superfamily antitoxin RatB of RatAB toxin-antitoxin module